MKAETTVRTPSHESIPDRGIFYNESDRIVWEEDLDPFIPKRIFDAHAHLWVDDYLPADHEGRGKIIHSDFRTTERWNERIFPGRQIDYLVLGVPHRGLDVKGHNAFIV